MRRAFMLSPLLWVPLLGGQTLRLDPIVVAASRAPDPATQAPLAQLILDSSALHSIPAATLDDALLSVPGFTLFRRDSSLTANPTTQGVSLRGMGPSGASRSLILLDGLPLNDPFGGWITWSEVPRDSLAGAEVIPGGGASSWGNEALSGVVHLFTDPLSGHKESLNARAGDYQTRSAEFQVTEPLPHGAVQLLGSDFSTHGYRLIAPENAGPVDIPASSHHAWITGRLRESLGSVDALLTLHAFTESRDNGTPYQVNQTRKALASLVLNSSDRPDFIWNATAYVQAGDYASTYSSVNPARTAETPASDQYAVPSSASGAAWTGTWTDSAGSQTRTGADVRSLRGETREAYSFVNGSFADQRLAGGEQSFGGLFLQRDQSLPEGVMLSLGSRVDEWEERGGHLRETIRATGAPVDDYEYPNQKGTELSASAGITVLRPDGWHLRANLQHAFRVPTLNELYRPFRQGSTITEANPALKTEHALSGEAGADWTSGHLRIGVTGFASVLWGAVDAVTLATGPATVPGIGVIPAGGSGLERLNLDRVDIQGLQAYAQWTVSKVFKLRTDYLYDGTRIARAPIAPQLVGKRLVQVPQSSAVASAEWFGPGGFEVVQRLRWIGGQYTDDQNQLRLPAVVIGDVTISHGLGSASSVYLSIENLGDARSETGLSTTGVVSTGMPRFVTCGIRMAL